MKTIEEPSQFEAAHVLLWSERQKAFHIETIGRCVSRNRRIYLHRTECDYILLAVYPTFQECSGYRRMLEERRAMYEKLGTVPQYENELEAK